jgi:tellurite resistance protein TerC
MLDLGIFNRKSHIVKFKEAILWSTIWVSLGLAFFVLIRTHGDLIHGIDTNEKLKLVTQKYEQNITIQPDNFELNLASYRKNLSLEYITGYIIEYALSVDNVFVMIMIFMAFGVKPRYYKRVLFWGILGAIIMRFLFIFTSAALIQRFEWILYIFGGFLIFTGIKLFISRNKEEKIDPEKHPVVKFSAKYFPVYPRYVRHHFFIRKNKKLMLTPLFVVLLVIEFSDVVFAVDSVPAIFSITKDPYIVFFSNIFAILGLRSLFFLVMNLFNLFTYLKHGLAVLLTFIGLKMIFGGPLKEIGFTTAHSLYVVIAILVLSILTSLVFPKKEIGD